MDDNKISLKVKLTYGIGDFYGGASVGIIGLFLLYFLTVVVGISPFWGGVIVLFGRFIDAITDPLMGRISDSTNSRFGRRTIWFLLGILPVFLSYTLLWAVPDFSYSGKIIYYLVMYSFFSCAFTMVMVPYGALPQELTNDTNKRSVLVSFRMAFSILGGLLAAVIPDFMIKRNPSITQGYFVMGISFAALFAIIWVTIFVVMKGREQPVNRATPVSFKNSLKFCFRNKAFVFLIFIYLFAFLPIDIISSNFKFYLNDVIYKDHLFSITMGTLMIFTVLSLPLYVFLTKAIGKKNAFIIGSVIRCIMLGIMFFVTKNTTDYFLIGMAVLIGIGTAASYAIPWAMLPEVTDLDEAARGLKQEGVYTGVMTFIRKLSSGLAIFLVGTLLSWSGYDADLDTQQPLAVTTIRVIITIIPIVLSIFAIVFAAKYPINNKNFEDIKNTIELRRSGDFDMLPRHQREAIQKSMDNIITARKEE